MSVRKRKCQGVCTEHIGPVMIIRVKDPRIGCDWGEYNYCQAAIATKTKLGLECYYKGEKQHYAKDIKL